MVIISEEGSSDDTRDILLQYAKQYPRVKLLLKDKNLYPSRTIRIADGRNEILNYIRNSSKCKYFDYLLFLDLDAVNNNNTIANTFHHAINTMNKNQDILALFPVSIPPSLYYDYYPNKFMAIHPLWKCDEWSG